MPRQSSINTPKTFSITLPDEDYSFIKKQSDDTGLSIAHIVRIYIRQLHKDNKTLSMKWE